MILWWLLGWWKGPRGKGCTWCQETGKDKKKLSFQEPEAPFLTCHFQNCEVNNTFVLFWVICYSLSSKLILKFREGDIWTAVKDQWASSRRERKDVPAKGTSTSSNVWSSKKLFSARKQCVSQVACRLAVFQGNKRQSSGAVPRTLWSRKGNLLVSALITSMMRPILGPCFPLLHHTWTSGVSCGFAPCISFPTEIKRKAHKYLLQEGMKDLKQR